MSVAGPARLQGEWALFPKGKALWLSGGVRHCPGQETGPLGSGRRAALPSGDRASPLPPTPTPGGDSSGTLGEGRPAAAAVVALWLPHVAGAARLRAQAPAVTDGVAAPSSPAAPSRGPPRSDTSWKHRRQSPAANRKPPQEGKGRGGEKAQEGAGAAGSPARREGREGGARGGASPPPRTPGHPFHTARCKFRSPPHPTPAHLGRARSPGGDALAGSSP